MEACEKNTVQTKVKVALEAIKGEKTTSEITLAYGIHTTQVNNWKKQALDALPEAFSGKRKKEANRNWLMSFINKLDNLKWRTTS